MDSIAFFAFCKQKGAAPMMLDDIHGKSAGEWWRETDNASEMMRLLQWLGVQLTEEQQSAIKRQPNVELSKVVALETQTAYTNGSAYVSSDEAESAARYKQFQNALAFESLSLANALRAVLGNPFAA